MLVLSRRRDEAVAVGASVAAGPLVTVTVLEVRGTQVKLGFEARRDLVVHRWELWEKLHAAADAPVTGKP